MNRVKNWEIWGAVFTIIVGTLLHFAYGWSGDNKVMAIFGAVNESTWEHLKLAFWPTLFFALFEWFYLRGTVKNLCLATLVKLFSMPLIIIGLFYGWLAIYPDNFIYDISIFIIAVILGYYFGYLVMKIKKLLGYEKLAAVLIALGVLKFSLLTYFPYKSFITHDPVTGGYGIEKK